MSILSQHFPFDSMNKQMTVKEINKFQFINNQLYLKGYFPGDVIVIDNNGKVIDIPQIEYNISGICLGINLDFTGYDNFVGWKIRCFNMKSVNSSINIENNNLQELIKLSLIFS